MGKRFSDAELAAEWFRSQTDKRGGYTQKKRQETWRRFCLLAHYDEEMEAIPIYWEKPTLFMVECEVRRMEKQDSCGHIELYSDADGKHVICADCGKSFDENEMDELEWALED